jgi:phage-related protein
MVKKSTKGGEEDYQIILLLHGLMKKGQRLPLKDKNLAKQRLAKLRGAL